MPSTRQSKAKTKGAARNINNAQASAANCDLTVQNKNENHSQDSTSSHKRNNSVKSVVTVPKKKKNNQQDATDV